MPTALELAKAAVLSIGYREETLREHYRFADVLEEGAPDHVADLVAFSQLPASYRTAAIAFVVDASEAPADAAVRLRSLGAPLAFVLGEQEALLWSVRREGAAQLLGQFPNDSLASLFLSRAEEWGPSSILRAKAVGVRDPSVAPDFIDVGLMPAIGEQVREKLTTLIEEVMLAAGLNAGLNQRAGRGILRDCFRLLAAKILFDRGDADTEAWVDEGVARVMRDIEARYRLAPESGPVAHISLNALSSAWAALTGGLNVANVSADDLAYVYENALVTPQIRKALSTHSTPAYLADYIAERMDFWRYGNQPPKVFEPFAGASVLLVAALKHVRDALPDLSEFDRHELLVKALSGAEIDDFAREVAKLSLILADYPNANGWKIDSADLFVPGVLRALASKADIVLCNPPYEDFTLEERERYTPSDLSKPRWVLNEVLEVHPQAVGFVLPNKVIRGAGYERLRQKLAKLYADIELVSLPDGVFEIGKLETALVIAKNRRDESVPTISLTSVEVDRAGLKRFSRTGKSSSRRHRVVPDAEAESGRLWIPPLYQVWDYMARYPRLGEAVGIHRGIEWRSGLQKDASSDGPGPNRQPGLHTSKSLSQFSTGPFTWLDVDPQNLRGGAFALPWSRPKIIVNAARKSRGAWRLAAVPDENGLVLSQQFFGLWPPLDSEVDIDVLAAILNGPIASAFCLAHSPDKGLVIDTLRDLPLPPVWPNLRPLIAAYRDLLAERDAWMQSKRILDHRGDGFAHSLQDLLVDIDNAVLAAYDLPRELLDRLNQTFDGQNRPVGYDWSFVRPWVADTTLVTRNFRLRSDFAKRHGALSKTDRVGPVALRLGAATWSPDFQFDAEGKVLPAAARAVALLHGKGLNPWQIAFWFDSRNGWLDGRSPHEMLADEEAVIRAADQLGQAVF